MTSTKQNNTSFFYRALLVAGLVLLCLMIMVPVSAQNTKGDRPRENRFKLPSKKGSQKQRKGPSTKRVKSKGKSYANSGSTGIFSRKARSVSARNKKVFSQRGPYVRGYSKQPKNRNDRSGRPIRPIVSSKPQTRQKSWKGDISGHRIRAKSKPASISKNVYPQRGPMVHNPSGRKVRFGDKPVSNRRDLAFARRHQGKPTTKPGKRRLVPRSISGAFIARKQNNSWKRFPQQKRKGEVAFTKDIAGRKLRKKNFESKRPEVIPPNITFKRKRVGDAPYRGPRLGGGQGSATRTGRAWRGDIAGGPVRGRNFSSKGRRTERAGQPTLPLFGTRARTGDRKFGGRGKRIGTASQPGEKRTGKAPLPPRVPGIGSSGIGYQGRIKSRRPAKGGGSVSGKVWNNKRQPIVGKTVGAGALRVGSYQGRIKAHRPAKGGGSVSGRVWNNRQSPIPVRPPSQQGMRAGGYPGRLKKFSVQPGFRDQGEEYGGHLKGARKKPKAAGSISGKLWNNKQTPVPVRTPPAGAEKAAKYPGKIKRFTVQPGFSDQGEEFTGVIKRPWYRRSYSRSPNAHEKAVKQQSPSKSTYEVGNLHVAVKTRKYVRNKKLVDEATKKLSPTKTTMETGDLHIKMKRSKYVKNPNSDDDALKKLKPSGSTFEVDGLQVKVKQPRIGKKPHAVDGSLPGIKPSKETVKASEYARGVKRDWKYIRNPSSSKEALRVREPGKAFAKATDYQGNIKMRKFGLFEKSDLHPDAKFVKTNKNNVASERGLFTNIKLWWAKTFKKEQNQPDHLKEKGPRPRYDKGEQGMWND